MANAPVCTNITSEGERRRRASGVAALVAGLIVAAGLAWRDASPASFFVLFPFAFGAAFGLLQARDQTCVILAFRNAEESEGGGVRGVADEAKREQARRQARSILWKSLGIAIAVSLAATLIAGTTVSFDP